MIAEYKLFLLVFLTPTKKQEWYMKKHVKSITKRTKNMIKRKTLYSLTIFIVVLKVFIPSSSIAMEEDAFKIEFATQSVWVKTHNNTYVNSTWEQTILNQGLAEGSAAKGCNTTPAGMCCSHAVIGALEYCHQRSDLLASYLHKAVTGGYDRGMNLEKAMNFVKKNGIMALPPGQTVQHGSGLPWPSGERYKFTDVLDADETFVTTGEASSSSSKSARYKEILKTCQHPIVVSVLSGYEGHRELSPFDRYRGVDQESSTEKRSASSTFSAEEEVEQFLARFLGKPIYHAVILYGFRKSTQCFFVKNSWGAEGKNGLCTLPSHYPSLF